MLPDQTFNVQVQVEAVAARSRLHRPPRRGRHRGSPARRWPRARRTRRRTRRGAGRRRRRRDGARRVRGTRARAPRADPAPRRRQGAPWTAPEGACAALCVSSSRRMPSIRRVSTAQTGALGLLEVRVRVEAEGPATLGHEGVEGLLGRERAAAGADDAASAELELARLLPVLRVQGEAARLAAHRRHLHEVDERIARRVRRSSPCLRLPCSLRGVLAERGIAPRQGAPSTPHRPLMPGA